MAVKFRFCGTFSYNHYDKGVTFCVECVLPIFSSNLAGEKC